MNKLSNKIKSRGYWEINIAPENFIEKRVKEFQLLENIMTNTTVKIRGWVFPFWEKDENAMRLSKSIGYDNEFEQYLSVLRVFYSGQIYCLESQPDDWRELSTWCSQDKENKPGTIIGVEDIIFKLTEIFEFASRVALTEIGDQKIKIKYNLVNIKDRQLVVHSPFRIRFISYGKTSKTNEILEVNTFSRDELIANSRDLALVECVKIFSYFFWDTNLEFLRDWQSKLLKRS